MGTLDRRASSLLQGKLRCSIGFLQHNPHLRSFQCLIRSSRVKTTPYPPKTVFISADDRGGSSTTSGAYPALYIQGEPDGRGNWHLKKRQKGRR